MFTGEYVKRKDECQSDLWHRFCSSYDINPEDVFKIERAIGGIWLILEGIDYCWQESSFDVVTPIPIETNEYNCDTMESELVFS